MTGFIQKLVVDEEVKKLCGAWIYGYVPPERFIELLYNVGFVGIKNDNVVHFRSLGVKAPTPPPISYDTRVVVHPSYVDALSLQSAVIGSLGDEVKLKSEGLIYDLPEATSLTDYQAKLTGLLENVKTLPHGPAPAAGEWEDIIGDVIRLCFFRSLVNVEAKSRDAAGIVIRDWVASNVAVGGFWEMVRQRYNATQVIWECKNYATLAADDFHQAQYYMTQAGGRFIVIVFRGEVKKHYYDHIRRIGVSVNDGLVLLLNESDILVFMRQARNGKIKESHIRDIYDRTVREIT